MITKKTKNELISRAEDFGIDIIFKKLKLKEVTKRGDNIYCICPFHSNADNPTGFYWSNGFGYCFTGCKKSYDLFSIIMKASGCNFAESVDWLSDLLGVEIERNDYTRKTSCDSDVNRNFLSKIRRIRQRRHRKKWEPIDSSILSSFTPKMHKYLRDRGFSEETREYFDLGFAQTGYLENRITIPIDYIDGSIVTVSGRSVSNDDIRYKVWFDTEKSVTLYNISRAKDYIELTGEVIVVEGFTDVWRLHQWGYLNTVATMGSNLSSEQRNMLLKMNCKILICGDKDKAGSMLNQQVIDCCGKFADVEVLDMFLLDDIPEKSSVDDISKDQFVYIFNTSK